MDTYDMYVIFDIVQKHLLISTQFGKNIQNINNKKTCT